ncbi:MarR family transcriptional regulator [Microvirga pakistanensis]|uniref:MarR family transcriptional regulator n=1 Tax=Microvirga pakistanensis TaxID=1682650 RepID=UPI00106C3F96|nr:MarR family transcriptional regulator [Microvirga pakistanensis]
MEQKRSAKHDIAQPVKSSFKRAKRETAPALDSKSGNTHLDLVRVVERVHRRSLDLFRIDLTRLGIDDISPSQVMMLFTIAAEELTVRDLIERGYYLGSNASYNLKRLVEAGYVDRSVSERDRRSARLRLSEKGRRLCDAVRKVDETYHSLVVRNPKEARDLQTAIKTLKRLERAWSTALHFGGAQDA